MIFIQSASNRSRTILIYNDSVHSRPSLSQLYLKSNEDDHFQIVEQFFLKWLSRSWTIPL